MPDPGSAVVDVWTQAVERAGRVEPKTGAEALHDQRFETVLGWIGFDENGDVYGYQPSRGSLAEWRLRTGRRG